MAKEKQDVNQLDCNTEVLEVVKEYTYLSKVISNSGRIDAEIGNRISKANQAEEVFKALRESPEKYIPITYLIHFKRI